MKIHFKILFLSSYLLGICFFFETAHAEPLSKHEEKAILESFIDRGALHEDLFLRLSELTSEPALKLAYSRQAYALKPRHSTLLSIHTLRNSLKTAGHEPGTTKWWHPLLLKKYFPEYQLDYLMSIFFVVFIIFIIKLTLGNKGLSKIPPSFHVSLLLAIFLLIQRYCIITLQDTNFLIPRNLSEFRLEEGVVLSNTPAYAAPSKDSHETMLLTPGDEIIIYSDFKNDDWIQIRKPGKRNGWISLEEKDTIFILRK